MPDSARIVWADLEMTGLDPDNERIIEFAVLVTGREEAQLHRLDARSGQPLAQGQRLAVQSDGFRGFGFSGAATGLGRNEVIATWSTGRSAKVARARPATAAR